MRMNWFTRGIGIDMGTSYTRIASPEHGVVIREPSILAIRASDKSMIAAGEEALGMLGRTPGETISMRPMKDGTVADMDMSVDMLRAFMKKLNNEQPKMRRTCAVVCVPSHISSVERQAMEDIMRLSGISEHLLIEQTLAVAMGAGLAVDRARGSMVVSMGGGCSEAAVVSLGGLVVRRSINYGGMELDSALIAYIRQKHGFLIGEQSAEQLKFRLGSAKEPSNLSETVHGRDLYSGLPMTRTITGEEVFEALQDPAKRLLRLIRQSLEETPPELAGDLLQTGITLSGGGALLRQLDEVISEDTKLPVHIAENPMDCAALGTVRAMEMIQKGKDAKKGPAVEQEQIA